MILTKEEEVKAYLPTSVYNNSSGLLSLTDEAEENYLIPVLGRPLYKKVCAEYARLMESGVSVLPQGKLGETATNTIRLIRLCQAPVIYFALANNAGLLAVSLNGGAGFSQVSTQGYESADDKSIARFERDAFFRAHHGIERLLLFLEEDARSDSPEYAELWRESEYYYQQEELLFTTSKEMEHYLNVGGREKFIAMLPDIRYCQDSYIAPRVGEELLQALVRSLTDPQSVAPEEGERNVRVWNRSIGYLRMALALYVESRKPEKKRNYSENEASLAIERAARYITDHAEAFGSWIADSPLRPKIREPKPACGGERQEKPFRNDDPRNAIFVFGGTGVNRH